MVVEVLEEEQNEQKEQEEQKDVALSGGILLYIYFWCGCSKRKI